MHLNALFPSVAMVFLTKIQSNVQSSSGLIKKVLHEKATTSNPAGDGAPVGDDVSLSLTVGASAAVQSILQLMQKIKKEKVTEVALPDAQELLDVACEALDKFGVSFVNYQVLYLSFLFMMMILNKKYINNIFI